MPNRSPERTEIYSDIIVTAIESGTGYWASVSEYKWMDRDPADVYAVIHDEEEDTGDPDNAFRVDINVVTKGFNLLAKQVDAGEVKNPYFIRFVRAVNGGNWDDVDFDAEIADVIVQLGLFNEVRYG